ncbi:MAG: hypothetical protein NTX72_04825 [Candidatus Uhrbacteria bacterium]|nr:hypothetical protein [Candidatus Uhrbacteria bacterium]
MNRFFRCSYVLRLLMIGFLGFVLVTWVPVFSFEKVPSTVNPLYGVVLFIFLSGFLITQTMSRNATLQNSIELELSRTRRIMHLIENMHVQASWKKEVKKRILAYLQFVGSNNFTSYKKSDDLFREMTHVIYACAPKTRKDEILFSELLCVTREIALQRQELARDLHSPITSYVWIVYFLVGVINILLVFLVRDTSMLSSVYVFLVSVMIFLIADLLVELNVLTKSKRNEFQNLYAENAQRVKKE